MQQSQQYKQTHPQLVPFILTMYGASNSVIVSVVAEKTKSWKFAVKFKRRYLESFPRGYPSEAPLNISQAQQRKVSQGVIRSKTKHKAEEVSAIFEFRKN